MNVNTRALHEVLAQKVAEKKAAAEAAAAELATYLKVQAAMTQKLSGQIGTLMAEQDLAQAATSGAVTEVETQSEHRLSICLMWLIYQPPRAALATRTALTPPWATWPGVASSCEHPYCRTVRELNVN